MAKLKGKKSYKSVKGQAKPVKKEPEPEVVKVVEPVVEVPVAKKEEEEVIKAKAGKLGVKQTGKIDLDALNQKTKPG